MGEVVELYPGTMRAPDPSFELMPSPDVIALLERLLERAREGDIRSIAVAWVNGDGTPSHNWGGGAGDPCALLVGGCHILAHDLSEQSLVTWGKCVPLPDDGGEPRGPA